MCMPERAMEAFFPGANGRDSCDGSILQGGRGRSTKYRTSFMSCRNRIGGIIAPGVVIRMRRIHEDRAFGDCRYGGRAVDRYLFLHLLSGLSALVSYRDARHLDETGTLHD